MKTGKINYYFICRIYDGVFTGDRSDSQVIISLLFSAFLRQLKPGISCSLYDIPHPVVEFEVYGRYIMPDQSPTLMLSENWKVLKDNIFELIVTMVSFRELFWSVVGCQCEACYKERKKEEQSNYQFSENIIGLSEGETNKFNRNTRDRLEWDFFYDLENEVTVIKSYKLYQFFEALNHVESNENNSVNRVNGELIVSSNSNNLIHFDTKREFEDIFAKLSDCVNNVDYKILFPIENMVIAICKPYIIALGRPGGYYEFKIEKEIVRERHNNEAKILFPIPSFVWCKEICPDQFELLIKALLEREPNIKKVRRPAPINQGDKGRDLIIDWYVRDENYLSDEHPPELLIKVVGQCKASNSTVGKSKVLDIRDTVETHDSNGFFLAVSSQISAPLTEKLEELKSKNIWTEWWNRDDIESRLMKNQDLIPLFSKVIQMKAQIKFVEM
ncbi:hypothetical protein EMN47_03835 [Prolixibacteraceae bacterium JC049]|nr:hypothetical protein [Prolixibacteraceae bacterium JC049]